MKIFRNTLALASALALVNWVAYAATQDSGAGSYNSGTSGTKEGGASSSGTGSMQGSASASVSTSQVKDAQEALKDKGYSVSIDGIVGTDTAKAIRKFQEDNNLAVTGTLTDETLKALNVASASPSGSGASSSGY